MHLLVTLEPNQTQTGSKHISYNRQREDTWFTKSPFHCSRCQTKGPPSLFWLNRLLILAWIAFVDCNKTITVSWAFIVCVRHPTCQLPCVELFIHSHQSALLTDFRWETQDGVRREVTDPKPPDRGLQKRTLCGVSGRLCAAAASSFRAQASCLQIASAWEHPFLLFLFPSHDVKKEKMILSSIFTNRKQIYMCLPHVAFPGEE